MIDELIKCSSDISTGIDINNRFSIHIFILAIIVSSLARTLSVGFTLALPIRNWPSLNIECGPPFWLNRQTKRIIIKKSLPPSQHLPPYAHAHTHTHSINAKFKSDRQLLHGNQLRSGVISLGGKEGDFFISFLSLAKLLNL